MKVLMITVEAEPFAKSGGLGDVLGALPKALKLEGVEVACIMPLFASIDSRYKEKMEYLFEFEVQLNWRNQKCKLFKLSHCDVNYYFVASDMYFCGNTIYDEFDLERFAFFTKASLVVLPKINFKADIIHCHDWSSALALPYLDMFFKGNEFYKDMKSVFTIHNLAHQGIYPIEQVKDITGLSDEYFTDDKLEFYGNANLLKGGIVYADIVTTVSEKYKDEIQTEYFGEKLNSLLYAKRNRLMGILNGIDYSAYSPHNDKMIESNYDINSYALGKARNKEFLIKELGLNSSDAPIIALIGRLVEQKGLDLVESVIGEMMQCNIKLVVLGTGESRYEKMFRDYAEKYKGRLSANIMFSNKLAHQIYAGSDLFLMPSRFEPCGLSQLICLKYGTLPIVREVGGLYDTIKSFNESNGQGNGFSFSNYNANDMLFTVYRAVDFYFNKQIEFNRMIKYGMSQDFSWKTSAKKYKEMYNNLVK